MRIRVTDFGSAKILSKPVDGERKEEEEERASSFVGTAEYVSPELLTDKAVTKSSDWWAFGCVLYQMLAGRPPFKGVNEYQTFQKILKLDFSFPEGFPAAAQALIEQLLVLDPAERLGAKPGDVEKMRGSEFFAGEDFSSIWDRDAPELKVGLYVRPAAPEPAAFDFSEGERLVSDFARASLLSPTAGSLNSNADDADASDVSDAVSRPSSPPLAQGDAEKLRPISHKPSEQSMRSSASSAADAEETRNAGRLLRRLSQGMPRAVSNWSALLLPNENLLLSAPIIQRKTGTGQMFSKKRQLVLTSFPRLLCVKESPSTLKVKSEVILKPPPAAVPKDDPKSDATEAQQQYTVTSVEVKTQKSFAIHTVSPTLGQPSIICKHHRLTPLAQPSRTFIYEDPGGDNSHWVRSIKGAMQKEA